MTEKKLILELARRQKALAKERDRLRALHNEVEELLADADDADDHLTCAIDVLSRLQ